MSWRQHDEIYGGHDARAVGHSETNPCHRLELAVDSVPPLDLCDPVGARHFRNLDISCRGDGSCFLSCNRSKAALPIGFNRALRQKLPQQKRPAAALLEKRKHDKTCRPHGDCPYCARNRLHSNRKRVENAEELHRDYGLPAEGDQQQEPDVLPGTPELSPRLPSDQHLQDVSQTVPILPE